MPHDANCPPYAAGPYDLGTTAAGGRITLSPLVAREAVDLGAALAIVEPWATYRATASGLGAFFSRVDPGAPRQAVRIDGALAGIVVMQHPWLHGPYLQFLGLVPAARGQGAGAAVLDWIVAEAPIGTRSLWLCVSAFNTRAQAFYARHGYRPVATLERLAADHVDEILMRRPLTDLPGNSPTRLSN